MIKAVLLCDYRKRKQGNILTISMTNLYHPQRSYGKVIFSQAWVKNSFCPRGVSASVHAGIHPPNKQPPGQTPLGQTPPWADTPYPVHAGIHTPCPVYAGIHPLPSACWDTWLLLRTVRILLECILVVYVYICKYKHATLFCPLIVVIMESKRTTTAK